jgi:rfaE bifunctional protein nucleotidyltransferase chain/domain
MTLSTIFDTLGHPRILVLGDLILDRYTFGNAERISPEAPVVVLRVDSKEVRLGGAASVAMLLRGLEAEVVLAGVVGEDAEGRIVRTLLCDEKIDSHLVLVDPNRSTTTKERVIGRAANRHAHQIVRVDHETRGPIGSTLEEGLLGGIIRLLRSKPSTGSKLDLWVRPGHQNETATGPALPSMPGENGTAPADLCPPFADANPSFDAILIADYAKGVCNPTLLRRVIDAARECHIPVVVDPARLADFRRYAGATLLKPNRTEAELAVGLEIHSPEDALAAAAKLRDQHNIESVLVTLDRDGMALVTNLQVPARLRMSSSAEGGCDRPFGLSTPYPLHLPAAPREIYDITGAGDMVLAALGLCIASAIPLLQAAQIANIAAGLEVERLGVSPITRQELSDAIQNLPLPLGDDRGQGATGRLSGGASLPSYVGGEGACRGYEFDPQSELLAHSKSDPLGDNGKCKPAAPPTLSSSTSLDHASTASVCRPSNGSEHLRPSALVTVPPIPAPCTTSNNGSSTVSSEASQFDNRLHRETAAFQSSSTPRSELRIPNSACKLISLPQAISLAATYRSLGKTLVFTNGCFDLLHIGHVNCLEQAAARGDVLVVAVNSDASVRRLKGSERPVIPEQQRAAMLAALYCVDHVLIFDDPTPHLLLEQIRPDLLVKGGTTLEIIGHEVVESYGGKVVRLGEVPGISTTTILACHAPLKRDCPAGVRGAPVPPDGRIPAPDD